MTKISKESHPALWEILYRDHNWSDSDGKRSMCEDCPFGTLDQPYHEVANDPTEAYYQCSMLGKRVWGEYSPCGAKDWQERAQVELGLRDPTAKPEKP